MRLLSFFVLTSVLAKLEWKCPPKWQFVGSTNSCFRVIQLNVFTQWEAEDLCSKVNSSLGVLGTNETLQAIDDIFNSGWRIPKTEFPLDSIWISSRSSVHNESLKLQRNTSKCLSFIPTAKAETADIKEIPCDLTLTSGLPAQHVLCEADLAYQNEVTHYCDKGWTLCDQRKTCHKLFKVGISSFDGAEAYCNSHQANVSTFLTPEEKSFLQDLMMKGWQVPRYGVLVNDVWIGLKTMIRTNLLISNGKIIDGGNMFSDQEPNGMYGEEPCIAINPFDIDDWGRMGALSDNPCDPWKYAENMENIVNQVLCEKPASDTMVIQGNVSPNSTDKTDSCTDDWNMFSGGAKCHKLFQIGVTTLDGANKICQAKGGRLSSLPTKEEVRFVTDLMQRGWKLSGNDTFYNHVWVSLTRDEAANKWVWNGKELFNEELGKVLPNKLDASNCAAFQPMIFVEGHGDYFGEVPCDTAVYEDIYPPSHILCERDHHGPISQSKANVDECPEFWHFYEAEGVCIKLFVEDTFSFTQAQNRCITVGGNLASIVKHEKRDFVIGLTDLGWRLQLTGTSKSSMWIGVTKEGDTWKWLNGENFDVSLFVPPPRSYPPKENHLDYPCVVMYPTKMTERSILGAVEGVQCELSSPVEHFLCEMDSYSKASGPFKIAGAVALGTTMVAVIFVAIWLNCTARKRHRSKYGQYKDISSYEKHMGSGMTLDSAAPFLSLDPAFEISPRNLELIKEIGEGFFGIVWKAKYRYNHKKQSREVNVAVKCVRDTADIEQCDSLALEITFLSKIGTHGNVIKFVGAITSGESRYGNMLILEFCSRGNLKDHLVSIGTEYNTEIANLTQFALQIASGMDYISSIPCIHRDLAARNILLTEDFICKITDFGLAKNEDYYKGATSRCLPFRWMAPETIERRRFTLKSDIWSFGIVLFEIYSLGCTPYGDVPHQEVISELLSGRINDIPENTPRVMSALMARCWQPQPDNRPMFAECVSIIQEHLSVSNPEVSRRTREKSLHRKEVKGVGARIL